MKILQQIATLLLFVFIGEFLNKVLGFPVPGNITGMVLLLISLLTGFVKLEQVDEVSHFLLKHLAVLFVPAGVGLIAVKSAVAESLGALVIICVLVTFLVMGSTAYVVQLLRRKTNESNS